MFILSLLACAVVAPLALVALVWLLGAYWPVGLLVLGGCVGLYRLGVQAQQDHPAE
jgi:hypothetical protein